MFEVILGTGERCQMQHGVYRCFGLKGLAHIPVSKLKSRIALQMLQIASVPGYKVVITDNVMPFGQQTVTEVRADETRGPRHNESQSFGPQFIYRSLGRASL